MHGIHWSIAKTCFATKKSTGYCMWRYGYISHVYSCYVEQGGCYCDQVCIYFEDCCEDVKGEDIGIIVIHCSICNESSYLQLS
jgi:hypothetical protein